MPHAPKNCPKLIPSYEEIEALAAAKALSFALELGITKAVLEGDSLVVFEALIGWSLKFLSQGLDQLLYYYTKRESNSTAHNLPKYTINILDLLVWKENILT